MYKFVWVTTYVIYFFVASNNLQYGVSNFVVSMYKYGDILVYF
jgi:hypothetical protein